MKFLLLLTSMFICITLVGQTDSDGDGIIDTEDPFPNEPLELEKLGPNDFQPKENVGWIEVSIATLVNGYEMPGIWHPIGEDLATWFAFDDSWSYQNNYYWDSQEGTSTSSTGDIGTWNHYKTSNPYVYTCKFNWASGTYGFGFTYDGRIDLDNDGIQDGIQIRSRLKFPAQGSQIDFHEILNALSDNLSLFALPINFTENDYDGDGRENNIDIDDDNDGIADAYDASPLLFDTSHKVPASLSGYVEIYFSDIYPSYGIWHGTGENTAINIWNDAGSEVRFDDNYSWDSQHLTSTGSQYGGIFRVNFKDKTNDVFFRFTYVTEFDGESADDRGKGFFYDGRIDLDNNGVEDGQQIRSGAPFPSDSSSIDLAAIYNSAESNFIPANVLDFASNEKYFPNEYQELRAGSTMIEVSNNQASIQLQMEQSTDLEIWNAAGAPAMMTIPADADTKFFRFKMAD